VVDGLDYNGYHDIGQVTEAVGPLFRDPNQFSNRFVGFANTVRYLPTNTPHDLPRPGEPDGDGVVVVPPAMADGVARAASPVQREDQERRRAH